MMVSHLDGAAQFELGTETLASWTQSLVAGGLAAAALGRAAALVEVGSPAHAAILFGLLASVVIMFSNLLISRSVVVVGSSERRVIFRFVFLSFPVYRKTIDFQDIAWVRVRHDGYKELFIEAGDHGYETTEILRLPYAEGSGIPLAEEKSERLASFWRVENKGYCGLA